MFTKSQLKQFRVDFSKAIASLEKQYNVKIELGSISYSDTEFRSKMTCTSVSPVTGQKEVDMSEFEFLKRLFGFEGKIGDSYTDNKGRTYTVTGLNSRARTSPVMLSCSDGKKYKSSARSVNIQLAYNKAK